jgi:hypothetical protein
MIWFFEAEEDDPPRIVEPVDGENLGTGATFEISFCDHKRMILVKSANYGCCHRNSQGSSRQVRR